MFALSRRLLQGTEASLRAALQKLLGGELRWETLDLKAVLTRRSA